MDLIKKSASVTENDYKRVTILFFKELGVLRYWYDYITTDTYHSHVKYYLKRHRNRTDNWYDRGGCMKILGMCDFGTYLSNQGVYDVRDVYNLYAAFLGIFWEDEYYKWAIEFGDDKTPLQQIDWVGGFSNKNRILLDKWVKLKNALG